VGQILGVTTESVCNWEQNHTQPHVQAYPAIMEFLGYCPIQYAKTLGERIQLHRMHQGLSITAFANILGVDECTLGSWERSINSPIREAKSREVIQRIFTPAGLARRYPPCSAS
jgi:DNA-binding transcriptional regulator YiaG